jgi:hypothetical protein
MTGAEGAAWRIASTRAAMITLTFRSALGESQVQTRASYFRFCADGTIRANGNSVAATRVNDCWRLGQRLFRELECTGPVYLRARRTADSASVGYGPYSLVRTAAGLVYGDDECLEVRLPALHREPAYSWYEVALLLKMDA